MTADSGCRIYAVVEMGPGAAERVEAAIAVANAAVVLLMPGQGGAAPDAPAVKPLVEIAQRHGVAALIHTDTQLARVVKADGVHLPASKDIAARYEVAREILGQSALVGIDPGISRHDAMTLAEAGADYIAFGAPRQLNDQDKARARRDELVDWWAEIFQVPCVAFDLDSSEEAAAMAASGADFVAVDLMAGQPLAHIRETLLAYIVAIRVPAEAG